MNRKMIKYVFYLNVLSSLKLNKRRAEELSDSFGRITVVIIRTK